MLSSKLVKQVLKEMRHFPKHAKKVMDRAAKQALVPHEKYTFGNHSKQYLCWYEPERPQQNHIILFYHGGAWTFGQPERFSDRAGIFNKEGYHVVMPSHRKLPLYGYHQIREDLILTLQSVHEIMEEKGLLGKKIILGGMSSGGNLAALLLLDHTILENTGFTADDFAGAFLCAAPLSLEGMMDSFVLTGYAGRKYSKSFKQASPINHLAAPFSKPVLVIHGTNDGLVSYRSAVEFVNALKKVSTIPVDFYTLRGGSHIQAVSWAYTDNVIRRKILDWLAAIE